MARSSARYQGREDEEQRRLIARMRELAGAHPRYGYRRVWAMLRREGRRVNRKRVQRLWRREGLKIPLRKRAARAPGHSANSCAVLRAERMNQLWTYDFVGDQTEDGRALRFLSLVDEYTRECLSFEVERSMGATEVIAILAAVVGGRQAPEHLRSDNGPEFIARAVREWLAEAGVRTAYVAPGSPWENAYVESFHSRVRDEFLDRELFTSLAEAKMLAARHKEEYNNQRPHSALGYKTPDEFAAAQLPSGYDTLRLREAGPQPQPTLIAAGT